MAYHCKLFIDCNYQSGLKKIKIGMWVGGQTSLLPGYAAHDSHVRLYLSTIRESNPIAQISNCSDR